jgi:hypothetical protein
MSRKHPTAFGVALIVGCAAAFVAPSSGAAAPLLPPSPLIAWWPGDGDTRNVIGEHVGGTGDIQLKGGATFGPGLVDQAFELDGVDDFLVASEDADDYNFLVKDFTIDLWVRFENTDGEQVIAEKWVQRFGAPSSGWTLTKLDNNILRFATVVSGIERTLDVAPHLKAGKWYLIALRCNNDRYTIFWNGVPIGSRVFFGADLTSSATLKFGHRCSPEDTQGCEDESGFYLNGSLDEIEVFRRALKNKEIRALYNAGSEGKIKPDNY